MTSNNPLRFALQLAAIALVLLPVAAWAVSAERAPFGNLPDGTAIEVVTLSNSHGVSARIITYGATLQALVAPDRRGHEADIALGYDDLAAEPANRGRRRHSPQRGH